MDSKKVGFTGKATQRTQSGYDLLIPNNTAQSLGLSPGDIVKMQLRNMQDKKETLTRKVQSMGENLRIYIPVSTAQALDLNNKDLLDVWIQKD